MAPPPPPGLDPGHCLRLLALLKSYGYRFITPTPTTHEGVLRRRAVPAARDLRDALGWSLPFSPEVLPGEVFTTLEAAGALAPDAGGFRSRIRVSSLGDDLYLHSAFPPQAEDAVFFGPDTYRFARFLEAALTGRGGVGHLIDIGTGSGAGARVAAGLCAPARLTATDVNPLALAVARINLQAAGVTAEFRLGPGMEPVDGQADVIIANPPFIAGDGGRTYRDGGDMRGARLSLDWALAGAQRLARGGVFLLYTGSAIVGGRDGLLDALTERLAPDAFALRYEELDPDIFGEVLAAEAYAGVERIAAVGAVIRRI